MFFKKHTQMYFAPVFVVGTKFMLWSKILLNFIIFHHVPISQECSFDKIVVPVETFITMSPLIATFPLGQDFSRPVNKNLCNSYSLLHRK